MERTLEKHLPERDRRQPPIVREEPAEYDACPPGFLEPCLPRLTCLGEVDRRRRKRREDGPKGTLFYLRAKTRTHVLSSIPCEIRF